MKGPNKKGREYYENAIPDDLETPNFPSPPPPSMYQAS
jgi:hypothetical protein